MVSAQDGQNVGPDLDPKLFDTLIVGRKEFSGKKKQVLGKA